MEPITREEYYLAKIAGTYEGNTPEPVTIEEYYLATMAGDYSGNTPQPVTRLQYYMAKAAGVWGGSIPAPVTRLEYYWAAIASGEGKVFPPVTREEHFLVLVADAYSVVLTVVTGNPALLENSKGNRGLESLTLYGKSTQGSTTGAQLISLNDSYGVTTINGVTKTPIGISAWELEGVSKEENTIFYPYSTKDFCSLSKGDYVFSVFGTSKAKARYTISGGTSSTYIKTGQSQKISIQEDAKLTFNFLVENGVQSDGILMIMLNSGSTSLPWEPYTGGNPSPSPQYPQEIESVGQSGEIGVDVYGGNLIKSPFESRENSYKPGYTFTQNGVTFTVQNDMGIKVAGTNTSADKVAQFSAYYRGDDEKPKYPAGTYTFSEWATVQIESASESVNKNGTFTVNEEFKVNGFYIAISAGQSVNKTVYPMFNIGSTALPYEPYKPAQTLIIPTSGGLPGIPVSSGGNYTDEKGQQWVCNEIDLAKGERVQWTGEYRFTGAEDWHSWGVNANTEGITGFYWYFENAIQIKRSEVLNTHAKLNPYAWGGAGEGVNIAMPSSTNKEKYIIWSVKNEYLEDVSSTDSAVQSFKKLLGEINAKMLYCLAEPIRTPLPPETIAAYKALHTNSPTTTVINDAGAGMSVGYKKAK